MTELIDLFTEDIRFGSAPPIQAVPEPLPIEIQQAGRSSWRWVLVVFLVIGLAYLIWLGYRPDLDEREIVQVD